MLEPFVMRKLNTLSHKEPSIYSLFTPTLLPLLFLKNK